MKKKFSVAGLVFVALCTMAATIQWYSQQPAATVLQDTMVIAVEKVSPQGYQKTTLGALKSYTLASIVVSNYYVYPTNFWINNTYVSNYVTTNVYNDTYASNYFWTNIVVSQTYQTNITITNFFQTDNYVSNFFSTNIYVNDTYVSNYFTTNIYTTTINTNYYDGVHVAAGTGITAVTNVGLVTLSSSGGDQVWTNDAGVYIRPTTNVPVAVNGLVSSNGMQSFIAQLPYNVVIGFEAGLNADLVGTVDDSIWIGPWAGSISTNCDASIMIGSSAGYNSDDCARVTFIGSGSGLGAYGITDAVFIGENAGYGTSGSGSAIFIGDDAGNNSDNASSTVGVGVGSARQCTDSSYATFVGTESGEYATSASELVGIGAYAGYEADNASSSVMVGTESGSAAKSASYSVFLGQRAGYQFSSASNSIFIGPKSGTNRANALWIDTKASAADGTYRPLIYGEFDNRLLAINGTIAVSNSMVSLERVWSGPTNEISVGEWTYTANTPCAVTNVVEYAAGYGNSALLSITNASSSNITFTVYSPIRIPYGETSRSYTITNGDVFFGSFRKGAHGSAFVPRGFWKP